MGYDYQMGTWRNKPLILLWLTLVFPVQLVAQSGDPQSEGTVWEYGILASAGYFNFHNSLYVEIEPDPSGNLSNDFLEYAIKPWVSFEHQTDTGTWFGAASWAFAGTGEDAPDVSGGESSSASFDNLYLGWRYGSPETGQFEVAGGRYPYQIAHGFQNQ